VPPEHAARLEKEMSFEQTMDDIARGVEILGVATSSWAWRHP
jgi:hypothetical protein